MKKVIFISLISLISCNKKSNDNTITPSSNCSTIGSSSDTLIVGNYKLWLITIIDNKGTGSLEVVDKNNHNIDGSSDFSINLVQLQNGNNCMEITNIGKATGSSSDSYDGIFNGAPSWTTNSDTKTTIKLTISGNQYYLTDEHVNK